jgi:alkylation response protein AidB-like acyl-CoA dehydrogenase
MTYTPPISNMTFLLLHVVGFPDLPQAEELDADTIDAILGEAGKLAAEVLAPLNKSGDAQGNQLKDGAVTTAPGFKDAYTQYREGGWNAVPFEEEYGGQGLPWSLAFPIQEMWQAANMSFGLCPLLNQGAVEAILAHGSDAQKEYYLPKLISGEWTGTMNLTEPQAGSDLAAVKTKAVPEEDGTYRITGQKIYITYGEHDFTDNIIHLVLARLPDAPEGVKGISLFIVPKFLEDGSRNDLECTGLEHKLGIHASPTCTMQFGDQGGATGYLVGEANEGLKYMFTMMNNARLSVGLQGVAIADRATQQAYAYASERVQGKDMASGETCTIDQHPDVQRMLFTMRALTMAGRAMAYDAAVHLDKARTGDKAAQGFVDFITPVVKSWCTDRACEVASLGIQVHGGMGFIEETGAAQYLRDARILPIYEGTNGIQANDFLFRKIVRDQGAVYKAWLAKVKEQTSLKEYAMSAEAALDLVLAEKDAKKIGFIAVPLLEGCGYLHGAFLLGKAEKCLSHMDETQKPAFKELYNCYQSMILPRVQASFDSVRHILTM